MTILQFIAHGALGFLLQVMLVLVFGTIGFDGVLKALYGPWFEIGEYLLPSRGPGSHAMGGIGGMIFILIGVFVYSSLLGVVILKFRQSRNSSLT
jgi:hypothetical protein